VGRPFGEDSRVQPGASSMICRITAGGSRRSSGSPPPDASMTSATAKPACPPPRVCHDGSCLVKSSGPGTSVRVNTRGALVARSPDRVTHGDRPVNLAWSAALAVRLAARRREAWAAGVVLDAHGGGAEPGRRPAGMRIHREHRGGSPTRHPARPAPLTVVGGPLRRGWRSMLSRHTQQKTAGRPVGV